MYVVGSGDNKLVIRNTANGNYGNRAGLTPSDYLKRLDDYNRTFPALQMRVIGVSKDSEKPDPKTYTTKHGTVATVDIGCGRNYAPAATRA